MNFNLIDYIKEFNQKLVDEYEVGEESEDIKISELHLHKILFFIYGGFYKNFRKELFEANFQAWKYGPVEIDYRNKNLSKFNIDIKNKKQLTYIDKTLRILLRKSVWVLVDVSHEVPAWSNNYDKDKNHCEIPKIDIFNSFEDIEI